MNAWTVVGPTNFQPLFFNSFESATDSGDVDTACGLGMRSGSGS